MSFVLPPHLDSRKSTRIRIRIATTSPLIHLAPPTNFFSLPRDTPLLAEEKLTRLRDPTFFHAPLSIFFESNDNPPCSVKIAVYSWQVVLRFLGIINLLILLPFIFGNIVASFVCLEL